MSTAARLLGPGEAVDVDRVEALRPASEELGDERPPLGVVERRRVALAEGLDEALDVLLPVGDLALVVVAAGVARVGEHAAAGDRRDWNGTDQLENQIEALGAEIKRIEAAAQPRQLAELKREIADLEQERQTTTDGAKIARIDQRLGDLYREQTGQRPVTPEPMPGVIGQESLKVLTAAARFHLETLKGNRESAVEYLDNCSVNGDSIAVEGWSQTISHLNEAIAKLEKAITESRM